MKILLNDNEVDLVVTRDGADITMLLVPEVPNKGSWLIKNLSDELACNAGSKVTVDGFDISMQISAHPYMRYEQYGKYMSTVVGARMDGDVDHELVKAMTSTDDKHRIAYAAYDLAADFPNCTKDDCDAIERLYITTCRQRGIVPAFSDVVKYDVGFPSTLHAYPLGHEQKEVMENVIKSFAPDAEIRSRTTLISRFEKECSHLQTINDQDRFFNSFILASLERVRTPDKFVADMTKKERSIKHPAKNFEDYL